MNTGVDGPGRLRAVTRTGVEFGVQPLQNSICPITISITGESTRQDVAARRTRLEETLPNEYPVMATRTNHRNSCWVERAKWIGGRLAMTPLPRAMTNIWR